MENLGVITEYNPFHNGHKLHIQKAKLKTNSKYTIAVMSGNYVQRGEPAILDKYVRTKIALENGVDVVIELPVQFATSSAERFAYGAIYILENLGIIDNLCFGTEIGDLNLIKKVANYLCNEPDEYKKILKNELNTGISYPTARTNTLIKLFNEDLEFIKNPNNILGVEYIKALTKLNSNIIPHTIQREVTDYNSIEVHENLASATAIRNLINENKFDELKNIVPNYSEYKNILEKNNINQLDKYSQLLHYILLTKGSDELKNIADITEGLENRIIEHSSNNFLISDIIRNVKTKRFTLTKLQRTILHILLDIEKDACINPEYIRILGFKRDSSHLLHQIKKKASLPVFSNLKDAFKILNQDSLKMLKQEIRSTDLYYLTSQNSPSKNMEFQKPVVIV